MNVLVFDIETVPDIDGCRRLYNLHGLSDDDVARAVFHKRRQEANSENLPHHLHKVIAISAVLRSQDQFRVWSLGDLDATEEDLLHRFFSGIERYTPTLVSWNGSGFDLPVIHYRTLLYPINTTYYWGNDNTHPARYHQRHTDLMAVLAGFSPTAYAPLNEMAGLCGFPGKMSMSGDKVWETYLAGDIKSIRDCCETGVLNTYLLYLNYQRNRGELDQSLYQQACGLIRSSLQSSEQPHLLAFEKAWIER